MTSFLRKIATIALTVTALPSYAHDWRGMPAVSNTVLASVRGTGATTSLSLLTQNIGDSQAQFVGEDLRTGFANWFADDNIQVIANASLIR